MRDITSQKEWEDGQEVQCGSCFGSGIKSTAIGEEVDRDFCQCGTGEALERQAGRAEEYDRHDRFDLSSVRLYPFHRFSGSDL
jgi:hypothetical protein